MGKKIIERNGMNYTLTELDNGDYQLAVPISSPAPGYDVLYTLSQKEKKEYRQKGGAALASKVSDMRKNHTNYKKLSWR